MNSNEAHRRAETLFKKEQQVRPSKLWPITRQNYIPCEKRLLGCEHSGWLATLLIRALPADQKGAE